MALFIGLMSGTSLDGVDAVLAELADEHIAARSLAHTHLPMPAALRQELMALNRSGADELHRAALAANALADLYAQAVEDLLRQAPRARGQVQALGAHGQTVRHRPQAFGGTGYTLQLINGALLAEKTGIATVCDFRSRDVAAGGQGAPLVPAFHAAQFGRAGHSVAVLNIGGIANLTLLGPSGTVLGFDCGPGNALMDAWCQAHHGMPYDAAGAWASTGRVLPALLDTLLAEPFFSAAPPKSTGRDLFNDDWLASRLARLTPLPAAVDIMATLAELTVRCASDALERHAKATTQLLVCGGGALNQHLMMRLQQALPACQVQSTSSCGVPPDQVEALAFAWLAHAFMRRAAGNVPAVTGALGPRVLGALYPA